MEPTSSTTDRPSTDRASTTEVIVSVAARELAGKARVFAGVGLPTLAVDLATRTSNPGVELIYESGVCGAHPSAMAEGIADSVVVSGAESVLSMASLFGYVLQGGNVDVGFLGAGQIDRYGSLNTSIIGDWDTPAVRLPGAGGAVEIMPNAGEVFVVMRRHDTNSFPAELDFCTSPSPRRARESGAGIMPRGRGVTKVFTSLGVLSRTGPEDELELTSIHDGVTVEQVRAATGWDLSVSENLTRTDPPTAEEIRLLRDEIDTVRLYLR
ncbi:MAG: CoA-transferase [Rhodococcus sp. (in: high G+C Gram-positive bacteria)]|uniref:CoA-transferase subunit beta n=1 Tax=Rhodococcus sp. TaxID=1831 RepID=UPI003BAEC573